MSTKEIIVLSSSPRSYTRGSSPLAGSKHLANSPVRFKRTPNLSRGSRIAEIPKGAQTGFVSASSIWQERSFLSPQSPKRTDRLQTKLYGKVRTDPVLASDEELEDEIIEELAPVCRKSPTRKAVVESILEGQETLINSVEEIIDDDQQTVSPSGYGNQEKSKMHKEVENVLQSQTPYSSPQNRSIPSSPDTRREQFKSPPRWNSLPSPERAPSKAMENDAQRDSLHDPTEKKSDERDPQNKGSVLQEFIDIYIPSHDEPKRHDMPIAETSPKHDGKVVGIEPAPAPAPTSAPAPERAPIPDKCQDSEMLSAPVLVKIKPATAKQPSPGKASPAKKTSKTITAKAIAHYQVPDLTVDLQANQEGGGFVQVEDLEVVRPQVAAAAKPSNLELPDKLEAEISESKAKKTKAKVPRKSRAKKKAVIEIPKVPSPEHALQKLDEQDFLFMTSSQMVREQSPTFLRDLHTAMRISEREQCPRERSPCSLHPTVKEGSTGLWDRGTRDYEGKLLAAEPIATRLRIPVKKPLPEITVIKPVEHVNMIRNDTLSPNGDASERPLKRLKLSTKSVKSRLLLQPVVEPGVLLSPSPQRSTLLPAMLTPVLQPISPNTMLISALHTSTLQESPKKKDPIKKLRATKSEKTTKPAGAKTTKEPDSAAAAASKPRGRPRKVDPVTAPPTDSMVQAAAAQDAGAASSQPEVRPKTKAKPRGKSETKSKSKAKVKAKAEAPPDENERRTVPMVQPLSAEPGTEEGASQFVHIDEIADSEAESVAIPLMLPTIETDDRTARQTMLFTQITKAVKAAPRTKDPKRPSWHEKILLYDPIVLEDLTAWLNNGPLEGAGRSDDETPVLATEVQKWCESKSICCLWREGLRGGVKARY